MHYFIAGFIAAYVEKFGIKKSRKDLKCSGRHLKLALKGHAILTLTELYNAAKEFERAKMEWVKYNKNNGDMNVDTNMNTNIDIDANLNTKIDVK